VQTRGFTHDDEAFTPPQSAYAQHSAEGQLQYMPNMNSSDRAYVGTADGFRRLVAAARGAPGPYSAPQLVNSPHPPQSLRNWLERHVCLPSFPAVLRGSSFYSTPPAQQDSWTCLIVARHSCRNLIPLCMLMAACFDRVIKPPWLRTWGSP